MVQQTLVEHTARTCSTTYADMRRGTALENHGAIRRAAV